MHPAMRVAIWIFSRLVPKDVREPLMGDLAEEYAQRVKQQSASAAFKWYLRQIRNSILPLVWVRLARAVWLSTLAVALLAFFSTAVAQVVIRWAIADSPATLHTPLELIIIFPMVVLIGFIAERLQRRAAIVLGAMMVIVMALMSLLANESLLVWYRLAWFLVGPGAALIGSALSQRKGPAGR
jgi:hypothetical protein